MARGKALDEDILTDSTYYILLTLTRRVILGSSLSE